MSSTLGKGSVSFAVDSEFSIGFRTTNDHYSIDMQSFSGTVSLPVQGSRSLKTPTTPPSFSAPAVKLDAAGLAGDDQPVTKTEPMECVTGELARNQTLNMTPSSPAAQLNATGPAQDNQPLANTEPVQRITDERVRKNAFSMFTEKDFSADDWLYFRKLDMLFGFPGSTAAHDVAQSLRGPVVFPVHHVPSFPYQEMLDRDFADEVAASRGFPMASFHAQPARHPAEVVADAVDPVADHGGVANGEAAQDNAQATASVLANTTPMEQEDAQQVDIAGTINYVSPTVEDDIENADVEPVASPEAVDGPTPLEYRLASLPAEATAALVEVDTDLARELEHTRRRQEAVTAAAEVHADLARELEHTRTRLEALQLPNPTNDTVAAPISPPANPNIGPASPSANTGPTAPGTDPPPFHSAIQGSSNTSHSLECIKQYIDSGNISCNMCATPHAPSVLALDLHLFLQCNCCDKGVAEARQHNLLNETSAEPEVDFWEFEVDGSMVTYLCLACRRGLLREKAAIFESGQAASMRDLFEA